MVAEQQSASEELRSGLEPQGSAVPAADLDGTHSAVNGTTGGAKSLSASLIASPAVPQVAPTLRITVRPLPAASADGVAATYSHAITQATRTYSEAAYAAFVSSYQPSRTPPSRLFWFLQWPLLYTGYVADAHVQRVTAAMYVALCVIGIVFRNSSWLWYIVAGMCADWGFRAVAGDRLAVMSIVAEMMTTFIPGSHPIASAPRQFAAICYTVLNLVSVMVTGYVLHKDSNHVGLATLLGIQAGFMLLEVFQLSLPALLFERCLVRYGLISDLYLHKAEAVQADMRLKMAVGKAKMAYSGSAHTVLVERQDGDLLMTFHGLTLAGRTKFDPIRNCSIGYSFPLLGAAGIADLFYYLSLPAFGLNISSYVWKALAIMLGVVYLSFYSIQLLRLYLAPAQVLRELQHPHLRYIFLLILIVPVLSIDYMSTVSIRYCEVVFWVCAPAIIVGVLIFLNDWMQRSFSFELVNAVWLIPAISLIVAAFELPQVYPGFSELAWLWLGFGLFLWVLFIALILVRHIFAPPLPDAQRPALFLFISTAALATAAVIFQDPQAVNSFIGPYSTLAEFLHWCSTFFAFIFYMLLLRGYFARSPFNMSYWAISFPSSALALIWVFYWQIGRCSLAGAPTQYSAVERCINNQDSTVIRNVVILTVVNASVSNSILFLNTVLAVLQKRLFLPLPRWSPASVMQLQHGAFRTALFKAATIVAACTDSASSAPSAHESAPSPSSAPSRVSLLCVRHRFSPTPLGQSPNCACSCSRCRAEGMTSRGTELQRVAEILSMLSLSVQTYLHSKRTVLWPAILTWLPHVAVDHTEARGVQDACDKLDGIVRSLVAVSAEPQSESSQSTLRAAYSELSAIARTLHVHMDHEEVLLTPLVYHFHDVASASRTVQDVWRATPVSTWRIVLPWLLGTLPDHVQRMALIDCFAWATPDAMSVMGRWLSDALDSVLYSRLCVDYPQLQQRASDPYIRFW